MLIRHESYEDFAALHEMHCAAFGRSAEANLVAALRSRLDEVVSLVACEQESVVGHILFTPVTMSGNPELKVMGLAPVAVAPMHQRRGIGSALIRSGLERCEQIGYGAVVVLGHPAYYPRFGFVPGKKLGIASEFDVPDDAFMVLELKPGYLHGQCGVAKFHTAFEDI